MVAHEHDWAPAARAGRVERDGIAVTRGHRLRYASRYGKTNGITLIIR